MITEHLCETLQIDIISLQSLYATRWKLIAWFLSSLRRIRTGVLIMLKNILFIEWSIRLALSVDCWWKYNLNVLSYCASFFITLKRLNLLCSVNSSRVILMIFSTEIYWTWRNFHVKMTFNDWFRSDWSKISTFLTRFYMKFSIRI